MKLQFAPVFAPLLAKERHRYYVSDGGRGGGRSWAFARALILRALAKRERILCARELQNSIKDSVHRLLSDQIEIMGLSKHFVITRDSILSTNGSNFLFKGLHHNITDIKSTEGVTIVWIEEAEKVSEESWSVLLPTIRAKNSEVWLTFNPYSTSDPTYQRFIVNPPPGTIRMRAGHSENPWFPDNLRELMEHDQRTNPDRYRWIWEGECLGISDAQVFRGRFEIVLFEAPEKVEFYHGADWGFSQDPTALVRCFIKDKCLFIDMEAGGVGIDIDKTPALFDQIPTAKAWKVYADSARPETISYMNRHGYPNVRPVKKWSGSVEDGVEFIKSFEKVIIHPRCKEVIAEFNLYKYKENKQTGEIMPVIEDKHNHYIDSLRYALVPLMKGRGINTPSKQVRAALGYG
jgi:phage terminase large subunit